jgi:hypothetical protein
MKTDHTTPAHWPEVDLGIEVALSRNGQTLHGGTVVAKTTSGSTIWVLSPSFERRMYHIDDGYFLTPGTAPNMRVNIPN